MALLVDKLKPLVLHPLGFFPITPAWSFSFLRDTCWMAFMLMLANPSTVFFSCSAVVLGELSSYFFIAFLDGFVDETVPSTANLAASNQSGKG